MSEKKSELSASEKKQLGLLIREGYIQLAGEGVDGEQLYEITKKGEIYFNREEE